VPLLLSEGAFVLSRDSYSSLKPPAHIRLVKSKEQRRLRHKPRPIASKQEHLVNEKWEQQKEYIREKLSEEKTGAIYRQRKIDVEPIFGFLKANLGFTRFSVRGK